MNSARCLGLIGGLGVGATIHYYEKVARALEAQNRSPEIVIVHAETSRVFGHVQTDDRDGLAEYLNGFIRRLISAGAEMVAIPAVTPHFCIRQLVAISPLPVLDIFQPLVRELAAQRIQRVAVFGTRYVIESEIFGAVTEVDIVRPKEHEVDYIHETYIELARTGKGLEEQRKGLTAIARALMKRDAVETIILAGTDLALLFDDANTDFPFVDCAALHIQAILKELTTPV
ncbi:MAG: aspartate/glutamate racemase family protein [Candidatus Sulfotelmatobacter sp.]|jgi:aspartate racemase